MHSHGLSMTDTILECIRRGAHVTFRPYYGFRGVSITLFGKNKEGVVISLTRHVPQSKCTKKELIWTVNDMLKELTE